MALNISTRTLYNYYERADRANRNFQFFVHLIFRDILLVNHIFCQYNNIFVFVTHIIMILIRRLEILEIYLRASVASEPKFTYFSFIKHTILQDLTISLVNHIFCRYNNVLFCNTHDMTLIRRLEMLEKFTKCLRASGASEPKFSYFAS